MFMGFCGNIPWNVYMIDALFVYDDKIAWILTYQPLTTEKKAKSFK